MAEEDTPGPRTAIPNGSISNVPETNPVVQPVPGIERASINASTLPNSHPTSTHHPGPTPAEATDFLTSLLDRPLRVTLKDNRTVIGRLYVIDGGGNMVLSEAEEFPASLAELFEVNRRQTKRELSGDEEEELYWKSEEIRAEISERWEKGEKLLPRSEPFGGPGTGWGGRGLGLVLAKLEDCKLIELLDEEGGGGVNGDGAVQREGQGMDWSQGVV